MNSSTTKFLGEHRNEKRQAIADDEAWRELRGLLPRVLVIELLLVALVVCVNPAARTALVVHGTEFHQSPATMFMAFVVGNLSALFPDALFSTLLFALMLYIGGKSVRDGRISTLRFAFVGAGVAFLRLWKYVEVHQNVFGGRRHELFVIGQSVPALFMARCVVSLCGSWLAYRVARQHDGVAIVNAFLCAWLGFEFFVAIAASIAALVA